jgi:hypothetical protein
VDDRRKCQTSAATPAEPGDLLWEVSYRPSKRGSADDVVVGYGVVWVEVPKVGLGVSSETAGMKSKLTTSPRDSLMRVPF